MRVDYPWLTTDHTQMSRASLDSHIVRPYSAAEQYWFGALLIYTLAPLTLISVLAPPRGLGFWWDTAMALGVLAASGLALLPIISARWWAPQFRSGAFLRLIQVVHRDLTYAALALVIAHGIILILLEPRVIEYLKLSASGPMLAGTAALAIGIVLIYTSLARERFGWTHRAWRWFHAALSLVMLSLMAWHLLGAGYYFSIAASVAGLVWLLSVPTVLTLYLRRRPLTVRVQSPLYHAAQRRAARPVPRHRRLVLAVMLCWVAAALLYSYSRLIPPPPRDESPCRIEPCL